MSLFFQTLRSPDAAAQGVEETDLSTQETYMAVAISAALATIMNTAFMMIVLPGLLSRLPVEEGMELVVGPPTAPLLSFVLSTAALLIFVNVLTWIGRACGGTGSLPSVMKLFAWFQFVMVVLQAAGLALMLVLPGFSLLYMLVLLAIYLRTALVFVKQVHAFESYGISFVVLILSGLGVMMGTLVLSSILGVQA